MTKSYRTAGGQNAAWPAVQDKEGWAFACFVFRRSCIAAADEGKYCDLKDLERSTYSSSWFTVQNWTPICFLALGESLNLAGSGSAPVKWGQLNLTTWKSCWLVNACKMLHSAIKQSIVLRSIWFAVTIVLLWNFMGKLCQETKWLMCAVHCRHWEMRDRQLFKGN